jgi:hypothetical protein
LTNLAGNNALESGAIMEAPPAGPTSAFVHPGAAALLDEIGEDELEVLAGFCVWLAHQDIPEARRLAYHAHVERYLSWRAGPGTRAPSATDFALVTRERQQEVRHTLASISLLRCYLLAASHRRVDSANPLWGRLPIELAR